MSGLKRPPVRLVTHRPLRDRFVGDEARHVVARLGEHARQGSVQSGGAPLPDAVFCSQGAGGAALLCPIRSDLPSGSLKLTVPGFHSLYQISGVELEHDVLTLDEALEVAVLRFRRHRRVATQVAFAMQSRLTLADGRVIQGAVVDLSHGGVAIELLTEADLQIGWRELDTVIDLTDTAFRPVASHLAIAETRRRGLPFRARIRGVSSDGGLRKKIHASLHPRDDAALKSWEQVVHHHLYLRTEVGHLWTPRVWELLKERYLATWANDAEIARLEGPFERVGAALDAAPGIGHQVLFEERGRSLGTIAFLHLYEGTFIGHQIGLSAELSRLRDRDLVRRVLQETYAHGFEQCLEDPRAKRVAGYCTSSTRWTQRHHEFAKRHQRGGDALNHDMRLVRVLVDQRPPGALVEHSDGGHCTPDGRIRVHRAGPQGLGLIRAALEIPGSPGYRPQLYREALNLGEGHWDLGPVRRRLETAGLAAWRACYVAVEASTGRPLAAVVCDAATTGTNALALFDAVRIVLLDDMEHELGQAVGAALLDAGRRWFGTHGDKVWFHYIFEGQFAPDPEQALAAPMGLWKMPAHLVALGADQGAVEDGGPGFLWVIRRSLVQDFVEHIWLHTAQDAGVASPQAVPYAEVSG